jgi:AbrB family looped-hinge helix DNA binding protein
MSTTYSITSKFQVTIPKDAREQLGISANDKVQFRTGDNYLVIEKVPSMKDVADSIAANLKERNIKPATDEDIKNARSKFYKKGLKWQ